MSTETFDGTEYDFDPAKRIPVEQKAQERDRVIVYPEPYELLIDIDSEDDLSRFNQSVQKLSSFNLIRDWRVHKSPSGGFNRFHVTVRLRRNTTPLERIFLQALLGSDIKRELLCWQELRGEGNDKTTLFFERADLESTVTRGNAVWGVKALVAEEKKRIPESEFDF